MKKHIQAACVVGLALLAGVACESQEFASAKLYLQQDDLENAEKFFLQALEVEAEKNNAVVPYLLARDVYAKQQKYEQMNTMLEEAMRRNPAQKHEGYSIEELVMNLRRVEWTQAYQRAAELYNAVIKLTHGEPPDEQQRETLLQAKAFFETAALVLPEESITFVNLVKCYRQLGDQEGEEAVIQTALEHDPENGRVLLLAGELAWKKNEQDEAVSLYQRAHEALPDNTDILQRLTAAYLEMGDRESALETLDQTQRYAPKDPDVYYNLGTVYANIGKDAMERGQILYREAIVQEDIPLEKLLQAEEDFKQAQRAFSESLYFMDNTLALNPDDSAAAQAITELQSTKKILNTLQRSTEALLKRHD